MNRVGYLKRTFGRALLAAAVAAAPVLSPVFSTLAAAQSDPAPTSYPYRKGVAPVGIQLVLAMDTSSSMTDEEFKIELQATAAALNSRELRSAIKYKYGENSVAIAVIDFDDTARVRIPWEDIRGKEINENPYKPGEEYTSEAPDELDMLANQIASLPRQGYGGTMIQSATNLSKDMFLSCPWEVKEKRVLDVFGDGSSNSGTEDLEASRDVLATMGVTINGFAIVNDEQNLEQYYKNHLVTYKTTVANPEGILSSPGRVWAVARSLKANNNETATLMSFFGEVTKGMKQKINVEVADVEEYDRTLARLGKERDFPLPQPVIRP